MQGLLNVILLFSWACCWIIGGMWLVKATFKLHSEEEMIIGIVVGLAAEVIITNFVARLVPLNFASWISALLVLLVGFLLVWRKLSLRNLLIKPSIKLLLAFIAIFFVFFQISRGLAIYDDYAHLPTISIMAAGNIPPQFALNPDITYSYHYFLLLFGAQIISLTGTMPWTAWDMARAFTIAPAVILGGLWALRVTRSKVAGCFGSAGVLFISGTRWLMLFIPGSILAVLSSQVDLLGAGLDSGPTLLRSLPNPWPVDGQGSYPFSFAFENGIFPSGAEMVFSPIGLMVVAIFFSLLLTGSRWRNRWAILPSVILISSLGLLTEIELVLMGLSVLILFLAAIIRRRSFKLPWGLWNWIIVWFVCTLLIAVQGGVPSNTLYSIIIQLLGQPAPVFHQVSGLIFASPSIVSGQLGILSLLDIRSILIALLEIGPVILVLPLVIIWGWKAARAERWFEATLMLAAVLSLGMVFVHFSGAVRNSSRLYFFINVCALMMVPLCWVWLQRRERWIKEITVILVCIVIFGGIVTLGIESVNIKNNTFSFFISPEDAKMTAQYWNKLDQDALVFDPTSSYRGTTVFGRYTRSNSTWYDERPDFIDLKSTLDIIALRNAGFSYVYLEDNTWRSMTDQQLEGFSQPCVVKMEEISDPETNTISRILFNISACP